MSMTMDTHKYELTIEATVMSTGRDGAVNRAIRHGLALAAEQLTDEHIAARLRLLVPGVTGPVVLLDASS